MSGATRDAVTRHAATTAAAATAGLPCVGTHSTVAVNVALAIIIDLDENILSPSVGKSREFS